MGAGAVAVGAGGIAGAILEACAPTSQSGGTQTPAANGSAAVAAATGNGAPAGGGTITIGFVTPQTGPLAGFASGDSFVVDRVRNADAYKSGIKVGGKTFAVNIVVKDTQSDPNRASQVAKELIDQNKVDM